MLNFLNSIKIFGYTLNWDEGTAMFWLLIIQGVLVLVEIAVFCTLILRSNRKKNGNEQSTQNGEQRVVVIQQPKADEVPREMVGLTLDLGVVQREFEVGDEFNCDGLVVHAEYNLAPTNESITSYSVVDSDLGPDAQGCYVVKPNLNEVGKVSVLVRYNDKTAIYPVSVAEPANVPVHEPVQETREESVQEEVSPADEPAEEPVQEEPQEKPDLEEPAPEVLVQRREPIVIEEESYEGVLHYDKSFTARYIQSSDEIKIWYTTLKNELLSYKKVRSHISWRRETFFFGREIVARLGYRGNTLCLYLPLNPADYAESKYKVEDVSEVTLYAETPCMYRLKNERRIRYAVELFATVMENMGGIRFERIAEDYYLPYEGIVELIGKGLAKRIIKKKSDEPIFLQDTASKSATTIIIPVSESTEGQEFNDEVQPAVADEATDEIAVTEEQPDDMSPVGEADLIIADEETTAEEQAAEISIEEDSSTLAETPVDEDFSDESPDSAEEVTTNVTVESAQPADKNGPFTNQPAGQYHGSGKRRKKHKKRR